MSVNLVNGDTLNSDFTAICNKIREKTGGSSPISYTVGNPSNIVSAIDSISGGGSVTPTFSDVVICDNSVSQSIGTLTFDYDIEDYDILDFECYNLNTQKITHYLTIPEVIMAIKNASSDYVNFNEMGTNQYICYGVSADNLTWTRRGSRNLIINKVTGYICTNMTVTKTEFYKRNSISPVVAVVEPVEDVLSYHYIFTASGDGASDQTQPCGMAMQIDPLFNDNSIGFFNRYNNLTAPIIAKNHSISCADVYGDNYWILCYYGVKFT